MQKQSKNWPGVQYPLKEHTAKIANNLSTTVEHY